MSFRQLSSAANSRTALTIVACRLFPAPGRGGAVVLPGWTNGFIRPINELKRSGLSNASDLAAARTQHLKLFPLFKGMGLETNPIPIKAAMAMAGMIGPEIRLPMTPLSDQYHVPLADLLRAAGVEIPGK